MAPTRLHRFLSLPSSTLAMIYLLLVSCPAAVAAYYFMLTVPINFNDDEGTLIFRVRQYRAGLKLYDQIYSSYGPVYYLYNSFVRSISGTPVTHDVTRMTTVVAWVVCALIAALIVFRFTKSLPLAAIAHVFVFVNLCFFGNEPGHPQELCMFLLLVLAASGFMVERPERRAIAMILAGVITAALLLVKVNIGVFMTLAVALAILFQLPSTAFSRLGRIAAAAAALILPLVLMKSHLDSSWTRVFCFEVTVSIAALLPGLIYAARNSSLRLRDCWTAILAFLVTAVIVCLTVLAQGVSPSGMLNSLVLINLRENVVQRFLYLPLQMAPLWVPWAMGGLLAALWFDRVISRDPRKAYVLLAYFKLIFGVAVLMLAAISRPAVPATPPISLTLMPGFVTPYCWLLLYPPSADTKSQSFPRILLSAIAILQTLCAYPMASSQGCFIRIMLIIIGAVLIGDSLAAAALSPAKPSTARTSVDLRKPMRAVAITVLLLLPLKYVMFARQEGRIYRSRPSLALPGAERIHVPEAHARAYQWLVQNIRERCDIVMGMPGFLSLNLWSAKATPAWASIGGNWMSSLDNEQQSEVISSLSAHADACIIYNPATVSMFPGNRNAANTLPLARYMFDNFKPAGSVGIAFTEHEFGYGFPDFRYIFMVRKERNLVLTSPLSPEPGALVDADSSHLVPGIKSTNR